MIPLDILNKHQIELNGKTDKLFIDAVYKLMRDMLNYKPLINKEQFFSSGYVELKALMACDFIHLIQQKFKLYFTHHHASAANQNHATAITSSLSLNQSAATNQANAPMATYAQRFAENSDLAFNIRKPVARTQSMNNKVRCCLHFIIRAAKFLNRFLKTPLVQNHRITNANLRNIEEISEKKKKDVRITDKFFFCFSCEKGPIFFSLKTLLEILTNSDEQISMYSNESSVMAEPTIINHTQQSCDVSVTTARHVDELNEKYESLLTRLDNMEQNMINTRKSNEIDPRTSISISKADYQNLVSRISLLENEVVFLKVSDHVT
jgi:hypothetical protein